MENYQKLPDHTLLNLSDKYSVQILEGRRKFMGLLPEIYRRRLFEKRNCSSIFEFGAKLGALSEEQVRQALNLDERCKREKLPLLRKAFTEGKVSINKLARVMSIATPANERELLEKMTVLPQSAVEVMVRDFKVESLRAQMKPTGFWGKSSSTGGPNLAELDLSLEILQKLLELQTKGIDLNPLLAQFLDERDRKIEEEKQKIVEEDEFGTKCAIPHCPKPSSPLHHTDRFSLSGANNPYYLAPLCKDHHTLAHSVDQKFQEKRLSSQMHI